MEQRDKFLVVSHNDRAYFRTLTRIERGEVIRWDAAEKLRITSGTKRHSATSCRVSRFAGQMLMDSYPPLIGGGTSDKE